MLTSTILALSLPVLSVVAAADGWRHWTRPHDYSYTVTITTTATSTITHTTTYTTTSSSSTTTSTEPITSPTGDITVISARSGSPIHLLPMNAAGQRLFLGGGTSSYCPTIVTNCPPGDVTAFAGLCSMDVEVPGGQQVYAAPDGSIGYTQAHSIYIPTGSVICPFTYSKDPGSSFGVLSTNAFNATGLMACPTTTGAWQVFAAFPQAVVPSGNVADCLGFDALTSDFTGGLAAWQYT